jgi:hypothetical protein
VYTSLGVSRYTSFGDVTSQDSVALVCLAGGMLPLMFTLVLSLNPSISYDADMAGEGRDELEDVLERGARYWWTCGGYTALGLGGMDMWEVVEGRCGWINIALAASARTGTPGGAMGGGLPPEGRR